MINTETHATLGTRHNTNIKQQNYTKEKTYKQTEIKKQQRKDNNNTNKIINGPHHKNSRQ